MLWRGVATAAFRNCFATTHTPPGGEMPSSRKQWETADNRVGGCVRVLFTIPHLHDDILSL